MAIVVRKAVAPEPRVLDLLCRTNLVDLSVFSHREQWYLSLPSICNVSEDGQSFERRATHDSQLHMSSLTRQ